VPRFRPRLEILEDRTVPTVVNVAGGDTAGLLAAINTANADSQADTIALAANSTYNLTAVDHNGSNGPDGLPVVTTTHGLTIQGNGATIERSSAAGTPQFRILEVQPNAIATLQGLTIANGSVTEAPANGFSGGGGVLNDKGTLTVSNTTFLSNSVIGATGSLALGGAIESASSLTVTAMLNVSNSTFTLNSVTGGSGNAGLGGGIYNDGTLTLSNSTFTSNSATGGNGTNGELGGGGGIASDFGTATVTNSTFASNSAIGGSGTNQGGEGLGGGILNLLGAAGPPSMTVSNTTVTSNAAVGGSGAFGFGFGGGIDNTATLTINNSIVGNNTGGDILGGVAVDAANSFNNLIGTGGSGGLVNGANGNQVGVANLGLAPLGNYGGPTQTIALLPGSPAIDAGTSSGAPTTDQRGVSRVGAVDIGAFESQGFTMTLTSGDNQVTAPSTAFANALDVTVTANNSVEPVAGGIVAFAGPTSGAGINPNSVTGVIAGNGQASATVTANGIGSTASYVVAASATGANSVNFHLTNDAIPAVTAPSAVTEYEDVAQLINGISVSHSAGANLTVTLAASQGTLTLGTTTGLMVTNNGAGVTLAGSIADLNAALAGLLYQGRLNYSGSDTLTITAGDGLLTTHASVAITVKSAAQQAADLQSQVAALQNAGVLNGRQANSLIVVLDLHGNAGDVGKVQAFLDQVHAFLNARILTQAQADALLGPGGILLTSVSVR
jgi:hypothetical protein